MQRIGSIDGFLAQNERVLVCLDEVQPCFDLLAERGSKWEFVDGYGEGELNNDVKNMIEAGMFDIEAEDGFYYSDDPTRAAKGFALRLKRPPEHPKAGLMTRVMEHCEEGRKNARGDWFAICLQGSQNYGLADEGSDVDTKLLVLPSFEDVVLNREAVSKTHVMGNGEHCDVKDVREYFKIFRKQNANFVEILFTEWHLFNPDYADLWLTLMERREDIARYCPYRAAKCMKGMAYEKLNALTHRYPSRAEWIDRYGYDPKQLSHIMRMEVMLERYVGYEPYAHCLDMSDRPELLRVKRDGDGMTAAEAVQTAQEACKRISATADAFCERTGLRTDESVDELLDGILFEALSRSFKRALS